MGVVVIGVGVESGGFIVLRIYLERYERLGWGYCMFILDIYNYTDYQLKYAAVHSFNT